MRSFTAFRFPTKNTTHLPGHGATRRASIEGLLGPGMSCCSWFCVFLYASFFFEHSWSTCQRQLFHPVAKSRFSTTAQDRVHECTPQDSSALPPPWDGLDGVVSHLGPKELDRPAVRPAAGAPDRPPDLPTDRGRPTGPPDRTPIRRPLGGSCPPLHPHRHELGVRLRQFQAPRRRRRVLPAVRRPAVRRCRAASAALRRRLLEDAGERLRRGAHCQLVPEAVVRVWEGLIPASSMGISTHPSTLQRRADSNFESTGAPSQIKPPPCRTLSPVPIHTTARPIRPT